MLIKSKLTMFGIAFTLAAPILTGCVNTKIGGSETEKALCQTWGESLASKSRGDDPETIREVDESYADFEDACPDHSHLVPM